jgi:hypothetical protein
MDELEFTTEQMVIIKSINNSKELIKLFKRLIYISKLFLYRFKLLYRTRF